MAFLNTDIPELSGFDTGLCLSNLDVLTQRQNQQGESFLAVLSELADAILHDAGGDPDTVDSILLSLQAMPGAEGESANLPAANSLTRVSPVNREPLIRLSAHAGLMARLLLYRMIGERTASDGDDAKTAASSPLPATVRGRIAYMPGALADKAYLRLSPLVKAPRAAATAGFADACEEVQGGLCEYCMLPLENTGSGRLTAFSSLILRYRLQIIAVSDLESGGTRGQSTRIALLRTAVEDGFPTPLYRPPAGERLCLELFHVTDSLSLTDLLLAAEFCGMPPLRTDTLPPEEVEGAGGDGTPITAIVLDASEGDLATFRRFLSLEAPEDFVAGLYGVL